MPKRLAIAGTLAIALLAVTPAASAQTLEKKNFNYSEWTGLFGAVTVLGPGKMIFLAGVGAEDGTARRHIRTRATSGPVQILLRQDWAALEKHGATLATSSRWSPT